MPFPIRFCNPCLLPAESFIQPRSSSSIKSLLRRQFLKKRSTTILQHCTQRDDQSPSIRKFHRIKGSNIVREVFTNKESSSSSKTINNYDMTILHDDELDNTQLAVSRRRKKKIPSWANKNQLQLAIINQVYFQDKNPEDIFGSICIDHAFDMINSIDNQQSTPIRHFL